MLKKKDIPKIGLVLLGSLIVGFVINAIFIPHHILSGGIAGIAIFIHLLTGIHTALLIPVLNIPVFLIGYRFTDKKFMMLSIIGMVGLSISLAITKNITVPTRDMFTSVLLGGFLNGLGIGIVFRGHGSTGGTDIIAKILHKFFSFSMGSILFAFNVFIIGLSTFAFGLDLAIYTLATMFIGRSITNYVLEGVNYKRTVFIITDQYQAVADGIMKKLDRGVTILAGEGAYTNTPKHILYTTIGIRQVAKLKEIVRATDPKAFVTITETAQVFGKGFVSIEDQ